MWGRRIFWYPPEGPGIELTDLQNGLVVQWNLTGFMRPPYEAVTKRLPGQSGSRLISVVANERELEVGLAVLGRTRGEFLERARALVRRLQPTNGLGTLQVIEEDGTTRSVDCICIEGAEGSEVKGTGGRTWWQLTLTFLAPQPYARTQSISVSWSLQPSGIGWFPIIPIRLAPPGIGGRKTVHNPGDVESFPLIVVQGPGHGLVARNRRTGKAAHLDYAIPGEGPASVITINTARGAQSVMDGVNRNLFEHLTDDDPSLWSLLPGDNDVEVQLLSTGSTSSVTITFDPLYESL